MVKKKNEILSRETAVALKAEIKQYSETFNVSDTQKIVQEVVAEVSNDLLQKWINENMDKVVKSAVKEELQNIANKKLRKK